MKKKKLKAPKLKAFKIFFRAYERDCVEYFRQTETEENINKELKNLCETYVLIKKIKVLLPFKKEYMLWENRKRNLHKQPTEQELEKVNKDIKSATKK